MATFRKRFSPRTSKFSYTATVRTKDGSKSETFTSKRKAEEWAEDQGSGLRRGTTVINNKATVKGALEAYRKAKDADKKPLDKSREAIVEFWDAKIGGRKLASITRDDLFKLREELVEAGRSASTTNHYISALCSAFAVAVARGWVARNPVSDVGQPKAAKLRRSEPKGRVRYLNDKERRDLLEACQQSAEPSLYPLVLAALSTGCRAGELLALKWADVDLDRGLASIQDSKNDERRAVPLQGPIVQVLRDLRHQVAAGRDESELDHEPVFQPSDSNYRRPWGVALKAAKVKNFRFHDLRHSAASYLVQAGASLYLVGKVLGHRTPAMTAKYSHLSDDNIAAAGELLAKKLNGGAQPAAAQ